MVKMMKAQIEDAPILLQIQKEAFIKYAKKYGDFESNPYHMDLHRMEFNIKYRYGQYYKILDEKSLEMIGGIFCFELDEKPIMKIAQLYFKNGYQHLGYGTYVLNELFRLNENVKTWYVDTIMQEEYNLEFYRHLGFEIIDEEEEHEGLTFVTLMKKIIS